MDKHDFEKPIPVYGAKDDLEPTQIIGWDRDGFLTLTSDCGAIKFTNNDIYMIDKYGNTLSMDAMKAVYHQNSPTYEELYEHWLKTKDK